MLAADSAAPVEQPGLKVGATAPDFTLPDATGHEVSLKTLLQQGKVALAFVRSADWCPFCRRQLQDLQQHLPEIAAAGIQLVAISYDSPTTNAAAVTKLGVTFPLLSDTGSKVIDAYGSGFITAVATLDGDMMEVDFWDGGPRELQHHIAAAIAHEYGPPR